MWVPRLTLLGGILIISLSEPIPLAFAAVVRPRCANHTDPPYPYYLPDLTGLPTGSGVIPSNPSGTAGFTPGSGSIVGPTGASSSFSPNISTLTGGTVSRFGSSSTDTLLPTPLPSLWGTGSTSSNGTLIPSSFSRIHGTGPTTSGSELPTVLPSIRGTNPLSGRTGLPITYPYIFNLTTPSFHSSRIGPLPTGSGRFSILTGSSGIESGSKTVSVPTGTRSGNGNVQITASIATVIRNGTGFIVTGTGTGVSTLSTFTGSRSGSGFIPTGTGGIIVSILTGTTVSRGQIISVATSTISGTSFSPLSTGDIHSTSSSAPFANASSTDSVGSGSVTGTAASSGDASITFVNPFTLTGTATFIITSANISVTLQTRIVTSGTRTFTTITSDPSLLPSGGISRISNTTNPTGLSNSITRNTSPSGGPPTPISPLYPFTTTGVPGGAGTGLSIRTGLSSIVAGSSSSTSDSLVTSSPSSSRETGLSSSSLSTAGPITTGITGDPPVISPPGSLTPGNSLATASEGFPSVSGLPPRSITSGGLFTNDSILTTSRYVLIPGSFTSGGLITTDPANIPTQPITLLPPISLSTDGPLTTDSATLPVELQTSLSATWSVVTDSASFPTESGLLSSSTSTVGPITTSSATLPIDIIVSNGTLSTISYRPSVVTPTISAGSFITNSATFPIVATLPPLSSGGSLITPVETITPSLSISTKGPLTTDSATLPIIDPPASFSTLVTDLNNETVTTRTVPVIGWSLSSAEVVSTIVISATTNSLTGAVTPTRLPPPPIVPTSFDTSTKSTSATGPNPPVSTKYSYHHRRPHKGKPGSGWYNYYDPDFEFEDDFAYNY